MAEDGKYRRIEVRLVNKTMNAKLEFRKGYYASKVWAKFNSSDKEKPASRSADAGRSDERSAAGARSRLFPRGPRALFRADFGEDSRLGRGADQEGREPDHDLDFIGQVRDAQGKLVTQVRDNIKVKLDEERGIENRPAVSAIRYRTNARSRHVFAALSGTREFDRQDGNVRDQIRGSRPGPAIQNAAQFGGLEQPEASR